MTEPARFHGERAQSKRRVSRDADVDICSDPRFATHLNDPLAEPVVIFQMWKGRKRAECIRLTLSRYNGSAIADLRVFFTTDTGHMQASKKGIAFGIAKLPELRKALEKAEATAIEFNLIDEASE